MNNNYVQLSILSNGTSVASATTVSSAAAAAAAAITAAAAAAFLSRSGHIHDQISALKFLAIEHFNRFVRFRVRTHLDKAKSPAFAGRSILQHIHRYHRPRLRKEVLKLVFKNRK